MTKAERKICFDGVKLDRALAAAPDYLQWSDDQKLYEFAVRCKGHLAFLSAEIYLKDEALRNIRDNYDCECVVGTRIAGAVHCQSCVAREALGEE